MNKIFKVVAFFFILAFTLALSLLTESSIVCTQSKVGASDYIREIKTEMFILLSHNSSKGELSSRQSENNLGCSSLFPYLLSFSSNKIFFEKQIIGFNTDCIYNIFNYLLKIHKIRAP